MSELAASAPPNIPGKEAAPVLSPTVKLLCTEESLPLVAEGGLRISLVDTGGLTDG